MAKIKQTNKQDIQTLTVRNKAKPLSQSKEPAVVADQRHKVLQPAHCGAWRQALPAAGSGVACLHLLVH